MLKPFAAEQVFVAIFVLGTNPEQIVLVQPRDEIDQEWHLPSMYIDEFASPEAGVHALLKDVGVQPLRRAPSLIKQGEIGGVSVCSYRVNITQAEANRLEGTDKYHVMLVAKNLLKGVEGNGYLARSQRALLCP